MSSHETIGWAMGAVLLLGACGETASGDSETTSSASIPAAPLPLGSKPDFILVAVDGLRLDDAWGDPEVAPFLSGWMQTALAPVTMIGSGQWAQQRADLPVDGARPTATWHRFPAGSIWTEASS